MTMNNERQGSPLRTADLAGSAERREEERRSEPHPGQQAQQRPPEMQSRESMPPRPSDAPANPQMQRQPGDGRPTPATDDGMNGHNAPLFPTQEIDGFRNRWKGIQTGFVDEPRQSVEKADELVAEVMQRLAQVFAKERDTLEGQWHRGDNVSTEDLRVTMRRYRSIFERMLAA